MGNSKKTLMKRGKKKLKEKLELHIAGPYALSHEVFAFIYTSV